MRKFLGSVLFLITTIYSNGQDIFFEKELKLKTGHDPYPIVRSDGTVSLFFVNKSNIHGLLLDKDLNLIDEIDLNKTPDGNNELLGSNFSDGNYNLIYASKSYKKFSSVSINYPTKSIQSFTINLELKKEEYVGSASYNDKFYLLTTTKGTSILKMYVFTSALSYKVEVFDFKEERFSLDTFNELYYVLHNVRLAENNYLSEDNHFITVDNEIPNSIDIAGRKNKLYILDNKILLTLNNQLNRTAILKIDLQTLHSSVDFYEQADLDCRNDLNASSNSFISNNILYQFKVCSSGMALSLIDLKNHSKLNEFRVGREEDISFINSAIIQHGTAYLSEGERELSKTKQFLRKVSTWNAGVSVYKSVSGIELRLGGYKEVQGRRDMGAPIEGSTVSTPYGQITSPPFYNPIYYGYNSYVITKSVYFKSLLDEKKYTHKEGNPAPNAFDRFQELTKGFGDLITAETVFKKDKVYILGYYLKSRNKYFMRKIEE